VDQRRKKEKRYKKTWGKGTLHYQKINGDRVEGEFLKRVAHEHPKRKCTRKKEKGNAAPHLEGAVGHLSKTKREKRRREGCKRGEGVEGIHVWRKLILTERDTAVGKVEQTSVLEETSSQKKSGVRRMYGATDVPVLRSTNSKGQEGEN